MIESEYQRSESFRSLCKDFHVCARALKKWHCSEASTARQRESEYAECLAELEQEIRDWLQCIRSAGAGEARPGEETPS